MTEHCVLKRPLAASALAAGVAISMVGTICPWPADASQTVTVEGRLFYNDLRDVGHFDWRRDPSGAVGQKLGYSPGATNWLGAAYVVADLYEVDTVGTSLAHLNCKSEKLVGSATVNSRGEYSFTGAIDDDNCGPDGDTTPDIAVQFRLRFCTVTRCFSIQDKDGNVYRLWHSGASPDSPLGATTGTHTLADAYFESGAHDDYAKAANHFAAIHEASYIWHELANVPFYYDDFGELVVAFPAGRSAKGGAERIQYPQPAAWPKGDYHEYGHTVHGRSWQGTLGGCGNCPNGSDLRDGVASWAPTSREYPHTAFVEGWASFAGLAVRNYPDGCGTSTDSNDTKKVCNADPTEFPDDPSYVTHPGDGKSYARNVAKVLCDWLDDSAFHDDDHRLAGYGDHFSATLKSTWWNLKELWDWSNKADGLQICDYVDYYLYERKSIPNVGVQQHNAYVDWITNLVYNNAVSCGFPAPSGGGGVSGPYDDPQPPKPPGCFDGECTEPLNTPGPEPIGPPQPDPPPDELPSGTQPG